MDNQPSNVSEIILESEISKPEIITIVDGPSKFSLGEIFNSYDELIDRLDAHSQESFVHYWRRDSRTVEGAFMKTSRPIAEQLKYYSMKFACVFGGQKFLSRGLGQRQTQSMRTDCPAHIQLRATKSGQQLEVISVNNNHNHYINEEMYKSLPQDRRLPSVLKSEIKELLRIGIERKVVKEYIRLKSNKIVTSKDLFNISAADKKLCIPVPQGRVEELKKQIAGFLQENESNLKLSKSSKRKKAAHKSKVKQKSKSTATAVAGDVLSYISSSSDEFYNEFTEGHRLQTGKLITENDIALNDHGFHLDSMMEFHLSNEQEEEHIMDPSNEQEISSDKSYMIIGNELKDEYYEVDDLIEETDDSEYVMSEMQHEEYDEEHPNELGSNNINIEITDLQNGNGDYLHGEVITPNFNNFVVADNITQVKLENNETLNNFFQETELTIDNSENSDIYITNIERTKSESFIKYNDDTISKIDPLSIKLTKNNKILNRSGLHNKFLKTNKEVCAKCVNEKNELISQNYKLRDENNLLRLANEQLQVQLNLLRSECYKDKC